MSLLNSKFDITSVDNTLAVAALAQVLEVAVFANPASPQTAELQALYSGADGADSFLGGSPQTPSAASFLPGTVVAMDENGQATKATAPILLKTDAALGSAEYVTDPAAGVNTAAITGQLVFDSTKVPVMPFVTIDGNTDYSGRFVRKITVFHGGFTMVTDQLDAAEGTFDKGAPVTFYQGKIVPRKGAHALRQVYGFVGPGGHDTVNGTLQVIVPQGVGF